MENKCELILSIYVLKVRVKFNFRNPLNHSVMNGKVAQLSKGWRWKRLSIFVDLKFESKSIELKTLIKVISESEELLITKYVYVFFGVRSFNRVQVFSKKIFFVWFFQ